MWKGLRQHEPTFTDMERDLWLLDFACIQMRVNLHDWRHRKSCFKNGRTLCRYCIPPMPCDSTTVKAHFQGENTNTELPAAESDPETFTSLEINVRKKGSFHFLYRLQYVHNVGTQLQQLHQVCKGPEAIHVLWSIHFKA